MSRSIKPSKEAQKKHSNMALYLLYALLLVFMALYIAYGSVLAGLGAFVVLIITLVAEVKSSVSEEGAKRTAIEIAVAIVAVVAFFGILSLILQTPFPPVSAVASCSMLPTLHRGDLVLLHGIPNMSSFLSSRSIPVVNVSPQEMNATLSNMNSQFLAFFAYDPQNKSRISDINAGSAPIGLYNTRCLDTYSALGEYGYYYKCFVGSNQGGNLVKYGYSMGNISIANSTQSIVLTQNISINGTRISENYSNPIIVYKTTPADTFSGDIVHRLVAAIKSGNRYYLLTKGDNNQGLDIQFGNYPIAQNMTIGYVIADVPLVGYLKLIVSGQLATPAGCNTTIVR